jgi:hypothetical protein
VRVTDVDADTPTPFDTSHANIARVYDYLLGGKDNYEADRALAEELLAQQPGIQVNARANRAFMQRAVRTIATAGIDQFLDIGTGLPTGENVHQVAQSVNSDARVVYVDNDEVVAAHSHALLASHPGVEFIQADLREPADIVARAGTVLDLSRPVALLIVSMLHFIPEDVEATDVVRVLAEPLASGSYLVASHWQYVPADEDLAKRYSGAVHAIARRNREQIAALLPAGWEQLEPGLVPVTTWRPLAVSPAALETVQFMGVVLRKL